MQQSQEGRELMMVKARDAYWAKYQKYYCLGEPPENEYEREKYWESLQSSHHAFANYKKEKYEAMKVTTESLIKEFVYDVNYSNMSLEDALLNSLQKLTPLRTILRDFSPQLHSRYSKAELIETLQKLIDEGFVKTKLNLVTTYVDGDPELSAIPAYYTVLNTETKQEDPKKNKYEVNNTVYIIKDNKIVECIVNSLEIKESASAYSEEISRSISYAAQMLISGEKRIISHFDETELYPSAKAALEDILKASGLELKITIEEQDPLTKI